MNNFDDCTHDLSLTGVDTAEFGPGKVWECDACGSVGTETELEADGANVYRLAGQ